MTKKLKLFFALVISLAIFETQASAQVSHCGGFSSVREFSSPVYPPIAKAAHVEGVVIFLVGFDLAGNVESLKALSGPPMLVPPATNAVQKMKVNPYTGPRTCPFVVTFKIAPEGQDIDTLPRSPDIQHVTITALTVVLSDPGIYHRRRRFGIF